jgi:hypothetical protein
MGKLREANIDPMNYVSFYGLRTHSELKGQLVINLLYRFLDQVLIFASAGDGAYLRPLQVDDRR